MTFDLRTERSARKFLNGGNRLRLKIFAVKPLYRIAAFRGDTKISYPYSVNTPIQYVTLHFRDRYGAALLRHRNRAATKIFIREEKLNPVWFSWQRKSYPVKCDHSLNIANLALFLLKQIYMGQPSSHVVRTARDEIINRFREGASLGIKRGFLGGGGGGGKAIWRTVRPSEKNRGYAPERVLIINILYQK